MSHQDDNNNVSSIWANDAGPCLSEDDDTRSPLKQPPNPPPPPPPATAPTTGTTTDITHTDTYPQPLPPLPTAPPAADQPSEIPPETLHTIEAPAWALPFPYLCHLLDRVQATSGGGEKKVGYRAYVCVCVYVCACLDDSQSASHLL